jgi:hypothetical protein
MPRKHARKPLRQFRDPVPASSLACRGLCMDMACVPCWGPLLADPFDDLADIHELPPLRLLVTMDDATYAALDTAATGLGVTIEEAAAAVLREWTAARKARR